MTVAFHIISHNNALSNNDDSKRLGSGEYRPVITTNDAGFGVRLYSVVVRHAASEADASHRFLDWVNEAKWAAVDVLRDMRANPYDIHAVATYVAAHAQDWSRSFGIVQRIQDLHISRRDIYIDPYAPVQFRFFSERKNGEAIVSLSTPVRMRDATGDDIGSTPFSSLAPALAKTDAPICVKSGDDVGAWGDSSRPIVEWFIDDSAGEGMRIFDRPGTVSFVYPNGERIVVDLPGNDAIIGIDVGNSLDGLDTMYLNAWEWSTAIMRHSMMYAPEREKPALALYDDIIDWLYRRIGFRGGDFDESLEALRKALVDLLDVEDDLGCDEVIASGERFCDVLDDIVYGGFDTVSILRKTERGALLLVSDSDKRVNRRKLYFALSRS